ncbi:hypothetical protein C3F09_09925 [candidate division GN15 bacterium]|uniref:Uncharacterized protein n=1 Tax=candidate division GN15 bacterium TaxID=2072418 RepID=A0A855X1M3_9BACT|nr:MAG: hypothetical protein C3F09_09925 [candidate division GN15 bacterium]
MKRSLLAIVIGAGLLGGCVRVRFEPETKQQQTDASALQSKDMRSQWAARLQKETTGLKLRSTKTLVDSVTVQYLRYGDLVAERWRAGNQGQPQPMTEADVRAMVAKGTETQEPLFRAYEEMFEYALEQLKLSREVDDSTVALLTNYGNHLYDTYSAVFFPTGAVEQYENKLYQLGQNGRDLSEELDRVIRVYR